MDRRKHNEHNGHNATGGTAGKSRNVKSGQKILFSDLDGTLLRDDSTVSDRTKRTLDRMTAAGHRLVLTSGRPLDSMLEVMQDAGLFYPETLLIAYNGSLTWDCTAQSALFSHTLPFDVCREIFAASRRHGIHFQTYTEHEIVCEKEDEELRYYRRRIHLPVLLSPDPVSSLDEPPYKAHAIHLTDRRKLEDLKAEVEDRFDGRVTAQFSNDQYLEFYSSLSGKGNAILQVCRHFGVPVENSFSAGDAPNDISMLLAAGCGIAMKNADPQVKESADYITRYDNEHDGLADAVEELILNAV